MVGINAIITSEVSDDQDRFSDAQRKMSHYPTYRDTVIFEDSRVHIGTTAYEKYPIVCYDDLEMLIIIEGMIYNIGDDDIKNRLKNISRKAWRGPLFKDTISNFLNEADGEFIVVILDKRTRNLCIFNDALGRLPLFWFMDENALTVSREIKFINYLVGSTSFNRYSILEYLLYGFTLGERTLINGVERLLPATILEYDGETHTITKAQALPTCFDLEYSIKESSTDAVERLRQAFIEGLRYRVEKCDSKKVLLSLSGGLDSRAALAGLDICSVKPDCITYDTDPQNVKELEYTQKIADLFDVSLDYLAPSQDMDRNDCSRFVALCDGSQSIGLSNVASIIERISMNMEHNAIWYAGLYGGELLRYLNVTSGLSSDNDLVQFLLNTPDQYRYDPEKICAMTQFSKDEIEQHLMSHVATYSENNPYSKYIHFKFEKDYKWAGIGEDRNRLFFWTVAPFYSRSFFKTSYTIEERKKDTLLFRNFLYSLDPRTCDIAYYNIGMQLNNPLKLRIYSIMERAVRRPKVRRLARRIMQIKKKPALPQTIQRGNEIRSWALELLDKSEHVKIYFSSETKAVITSETDSNMLERILTLFIYIDLVGCKKQGS